MYSVELHRRAGCGSARSTGRWRCAPESRQLLAKHAQMGDAAEGTVSHRICEAKDGKKAETGPRRTQASWTRQRRSLQEEGVIEMIACGSGDGGRR